MEQDLRRSKAWFTDDLIRRYESHGRALADVNKEYVEPMDVTSEPSAAAAIVAYAAYLKRKERLERKLNASR